MESGSSESDVDDALIMGVLLPPHQTRLLGSVYELDGGVVAKEQVRRKVPDGRVSFVAAHRQHELVLCRGQPGVSGLLFTPTEEAP